MSKTVQTDVEITQFEVVNVLYLGVYGAASNRQHSGDEPHRQRGDFSKRVRVRKETVLQNHANERFFFNVRGGSRPQG